MYIYNTHAHTHTHTQVKREDTQCLPVFFYLFFLQVKREDTQFLPFFFYLFFFTGKAGGHAASLFVQTPWRIQHDCQPAASPGLGFRV